MSRFWDAYGQSYNALQKVGQDQANRQAGDSFASGDYGGAANVLARSGNIDGARTLQDDRQRQAELARESSQKQQAQTVTVIGNGLKALRSIPDDPTNPQASQAKRQQVFTTQIAPLWKQAGIGDDVIQQTLAHPMDTQSIDVALQAFGQAAQKLGEMNLGGGYGVVYNPTTGAKVNEFQAPKGPEKPLIVPAGASVFQPGAPGASPGSPQSPPGPAGSLDPQRFFHDFVLPHEGGLNPKDANGAPSNFGINQTANPGVDVKTLTPEGASQIFADKYFKASGAQNLPPALAAVQADTYFINPTRANQFLQQSGGDPQKYMALRQAWMDRLVQADPARYGKYATAWSNRNADLRAYAQQAGGSPQQGSASSPQQGGGVLFTAPPKAGVSKWDVLVDPKTGTPYRYNAATAQATTLDNKPYTPSGAAKMSGGGTPRSAAALAVQRYVQENPNATAEQISQFNANLAKERAAGVGFGTGKQGQTINSLNVSIDHLSTLGNLADALNNGNVPLFNKWAQTWKTQTGNAAPTNFNTAKQIVADEIIKGIVGTGGGVADRQHAQELINAASSPAQLAGVIGTYKQLLAGQLNGLRLQYRNTTRQDDFEDKLLPETRRQLEGLNRPSAPVAAGNGWKVLKVH